MSKGSSNEHTKEQLPPKDYSWIFLIIATLLIVIIWSAYLVAAPRFWPLLHDSIRTNLPHGLFKGDKVDLGTLGDYFGALNCLFAGLAYASVVVSIKQQSNSIKLQHKELKAQLDEMENSVKEAKEQNILQREYQFSDELHRRINLLKLIEKDIYFGEHEGQQAAIQMAKSINAIVIFITNNEIGKAQKLIIDNGLLYIKQGMDTFSVWAESYTTTIEWLHDYLNQIESLKLSEISNINDVAMRNESAKFIKNDINKKKSSYESIILSSTIWANQYLLAIYTYRKGRFNIIKPLFSHPAYSNGKITRNAKNEKHCQVYSNLLNIDTTTDIESQLVKIHRFIGED